MRFSVSVVRAFVGRKKKKKLNFLLFTLGCFYTNMKEKIAFTVDESLFIISNLLFQE